MGEQDLLASGAPDARPTPGRPRRYRPRLAALGGVMVEYAREWQQRWTEGQTLDLAEEMRGLTLRIAAKTLFDTEVAAEVGGISAALSEALRLHQWAMLPFARQIER